MTHIRVGSGSDFHPFCDNCFQDGPQCKCDKIASSFMSLIKKIAGPRDDVEVKGWGPALQKAKAQFKKQQEEAKAQETAKERPLHNF